MHEGPVLGRKAGRLAVVGLALAALTLSTGTLAQSTPSIPAHGFWRGAAQFEFPANGKPELDAHWLQEMVIEIKVDGQVLGAVDETGCRLAGLAKASGLIDIDLNVTLTGCVDPRFNGRFTGSLTIYSQEAKLQLDSIKAPLPLNVEQASISGMLHRAPPPELGRSK